MPEKKPKEKVKPKKPFVFDPNKPVLYKIERLPKSFKVFREGYIDAEISIGKAGYLTVTTKDRAGQTRSKDICFLDYREIKNVLADTLFLSWKEIHKERIEKTRSQSVHSKLQKWTQASLTSGFNFLVYPEWKHLVTQMDPNVTTIFRKFFVVRGPQCKYPDILFDPRLYENKNFVRDLLSYNSIHLCLDNCSFNDRNELIFSNETAYRYERNLRMQTGNWRLLFSDTGETYKALNKTLDNWPRGMAVELAHKLKKFHLSQPIHDRVKLALVCMMAEAEPAHAGNGGNGNVLRRNITCVERSTPDQIRKAFKLFKKNYAKVNKTKCHYTLRGHRGISAFAHYLSDFDQVHEGEIVGLLEKAHRWHQDAELRREAEAERRRIEWEAGREERERRAALNQAQREAEEAAMKLKPTATPPIPLPEDECIKFLDTVGKVFQEGETMGHCIASYARSALSGECYLFHIDYSEEKASIMVNKHGKVVQSYGPRNCVNKASEWAKKELGKWGDEIVKHLDSLPTMKQLDNQIVQIAMDEQPRNFDLQAQFAAVDERAGF